MKILISGGTGFIGHHLVDHLVARGDRCVVLVRRPLSEFPDREGVRYIPYDEIDHAGTCDAVINLAGEWVAGRWTHAKKRRIMESRFDVTRKLVDWMERQEERPKAFLSASAVGIYGNRPGEILSETSELDPEMRFRYRVCSEWEARAARAEPLGIRTAMLRYGNVIDGREGIFGILLPWLRVLPVFMRLTPRSVFPWISLRDAIRLTERVLDDPTFAGPVNVVSPTPVPFETVVAALSKTIRRPVVGEVPMRIVRCLVGEVSEALVDSQHILPTKALEHGFQFEDPDIEALITRIAKG